MSSFLQLLQNNSGIILLCLIIIFLLDIIIRLITFKLNKATNKSKITKHWADFAKALAENETNAFILLRKADNSVIFVSDNINKLLYTAPESIMADFNMITKSFSKNEKISFLTSYENRKPDDVFIFDATPKGHKDTFVRIATCSPMDSPYILLTVMDVSKEKSTVDELKLEIAKAKSSEESKTNFLSNMSHEIRTPLNGMLGMIGLARMNIDDKNQVEEYLSNAESLSKFLLSVINDILDMSRIESGRTELEEVAFDIHTLIDKLDNMFRKTLNEKGIYFDIEEQDITKPYVIGDQLRISQVLTNFLSNSSKFTPSGGKVILTLRQMDIIDNNVSWMFRVSDTGKGMTAEFLHRIFKPFEQENAGIARSYGGSGLGMTISDNLVRLMGGKILVDSEVGKGTTFTVIVKLPIADEKDIIKQTSNDDNHAEFDLNGCTLLLAEDQPINAVIVVKMLGAQGINVEVAKNGKMVVDMYTEKPKGYYDAILMDIQMPIMNGWEATEAIRALSRDDAKTIPIFALSADAFVENKRKSAEVGMNGHITKPVDYGELKEALRNTVKK